MMAFNSTQIFQKPRESQKVLSELVCNRHISFFKECFRNIQWLNCIPEVWNLDIQSSHCVFQNDPLYGQTGLKLR